MEEQRACPLEHHIDFDDARSCHWVAFSSSSDQPKSPSDSSSISKSADGDEDDRERSIGTIRLIPFPQSDLHPEPGSHHYAPPLAYSPPAPAEEIFFSPPPKFEKDRATSFHDGVEPYIKLGHWAVLPEWRGKGVGDALVESALEWVMGNRNWAEGSGEGGYGKWRGLVCVHAQEMAVRAWVRNGFVVDEGMGVWWEAGIKHWGMWRRVDLVRVEKVGVEKEAVEMSD